LRIKIKYLLAILCFVFPLTTRAAGVKLNLDSATLIKGYTVNYAEQVYLGVSPQLQSKSQIIVRKKLRRRQALPAEYKQISPSYYYYTNQDLGELDLTVKFNQAKAKDLHTKYLAYWDQNLKQWRKLNSKIEGDYLKAKINFPAVQFIALQSKKASLKTAPDDSLNLSAAAAVAMDYATGTILYQENGQSVRSMASLTKVMTAVVFLEQGISWDQQYTLTADDFVYGNYVGLVKGDVVTTKDLFYAMLVASSNVAATALVHSTGLTMDQFAAKMNAKAEELNLIHTVFYESSGLAVKNQTTAIEYAQFSRVALDDPEIQAATTASYYDFITAQGAARHARSTNDLVRYGSDLGIIGGKTGYLDEAGYCLMLETKHGNNNLITVVLGEPSSSVRFSESYYLARWAEDYAYVSGD